MSQEVRNLLSICKVLPDANLGYSRMRRIADIVDEKVIFPQYNLNEPRTFANREYLFLRDPEYFEDGFIGVWEWTATENLNDPTKDYTETIYRDDIHPIEVIIYDDLSSISQLVKMIKDGINFYIEPDKVMLAVKTGKYLQGFHINSKNFIKKNDKYFINEDVIKLPRYKFNYDQIVEIEKGKYLRTLDLTSHIDGYSQVKKPEEVVKEIILHNISWQNLKLEGYHREAYQKIKNYISGIKTESVTNEVKNVLSCTENEAKHYVSEFMSNVKTHLNGKTVEDKTLISLIERNEDLLKRCNKQIENEWIKENQDKIKEKEYELTNLLEMIDSSNKEIEEKNKKMKQLEEKVNLLKKDHEALEKLGSDFKMKIQEKITSAKEDVASFMSDMTFLTASIPTAPIIKKDEYVEKEIKRSAYCPSAIIQKIEDENKRWRETIDTLIFGLESKGIKNCSNELASMMYSCYVNKFPILLVGPYGEHLANSFSGAIESKKAAILDCSNEITSDDIDNASLENILLVTNVFSSKSKDTVIEKLSMSDAFVIYTIPFKEDLKIEPKGLLNYMLPIFTEDLFEDIPTKEIYTGVKTKDYEEYEQSNVSKSLTKKLYSKTGCSNLVINFYGNLIRDAKIISKNQKDDIEYQFVLYPIAYLTNSESKIIDDVKSASNLSKDIKDSLIKKLQEEE